MLPSPTAAAPEHTISQDIALDPGENAIEVVAYDRHNLIASVSARTTLRLATAQATTKPKLHILAIGIDAYIDRGWTPPGATEPSLFSPLSLAVKDARSFAAAMEQAAGGLYAGNPSVTLALDGDATRDALEATITRLAAEIGPRDTFVLFAAAHGDSRGGRFYLIPQDYDGGPDPAALAQRAIGQDRLQDWLANRIKARRAIVLLDTCESGALIAGYKRSRLEDAGAEAAIGRLHEATGRPVLTAAATGEFAHEGIVGATGANHGIFTWALLDALRNGDRDANGTIELSEIVAHVQEQVPRLAAQLKSGGRASSVVAGPVFGKQSARFGSRGEDFALVNRLR